MCLSNKNLFSIVRDLLGKLQTGTGSRLSFLSLFLSVIEHNDSLPMEIGSYEIGMNFESHKHTLNEKKKEKLYCPEFRCRLLLVPPLTSLVSSSIVCVKTSTEYPKMFITELSTDFFELFTLFGKVKISVVPSKVYVKIERKILNELLLLLLLDSRMKDGLW